MTMPQEMTQTVTKVLNDSWQLAEANWRALNGATNLGTMYELGFKAWKQWAEMQMAFVDACWRFGQLSMDLRSAEEETSTTGTAEHHTSRHRRIAASH
ncbi:MAG: hypothetical protein ACT4NU_06525 [Chromatiales bacterium]